MNEPIQDVASTPEAAAPVAADSSPAPLETSGELASGVTTPDATAEAQQPEDPFASLPPDEELEAQIAQKVPYAIALKQIRDAHTAYKAETEPWQSWKPVADKIGDPQQVLVNQELIRGLHAPVLDPTTQQPIPGKYTSLPFLQKLETESPGTVDSLFTTTLSFQVPDAQGKPSTVVRELVKSWGLDPDRLDDYRNIDQRAPQTGFVTPDQLAGIDPKFHEAFKALSPAQRDDILALKSDDGYPSQVSDYLTDKMEAMETRKWREEDQKAKAEAQQRDQALYEQQTERAVTEDIDSLTVEMYESIHQGLAQVKFSSDEGIDAVERAKVMGVVASLVDPSVRRMARAEDALAKAGNPLDPKFDELVAAFAGGRGAYVRHTRAGDQMQAREALTAANLAKNQLLVKLGKYAESLAKPSAQNRQAQSQSLVNSLQGATARVIPQGSTSQQSANGNPYALPPGVQPMSPEADAHFANVARQMRAT